MINKIMGTIAKGCNMIGALALLIMLVVTVGDVIMNKIFGAPFAGSTEITTTLMPISVFAFLLSTQIQGRHIAIDAVTTHLNPTAQTILAIFGYLIGIFLFGFLTQLNIPMAIYSVQIGEHTGGNVAVPMYPAKVMIPIATGLITIQLFIELCRTLYKAFTGQNRDKEQPAAG